MDIVGVVLALVALGGLAMVDRRSQNRFERLETAPTPPPHEPVDLGPLEERLDQHASAINSTQAALEELQGELRDQNLAIADGIERVDRAERRVRSAVSRARKRMADLGYVDEGLEAEAEGLREIDGDEGAGEGMPAMRGDLGGPPARDMSAFPGRWD